MDRAPVEQLSESGLVIWLTGLPSSGKTTIARALAKQLLLDEYRIELLDGDEIRKELCPGLGFTREDRDENIRRIGLVASLLARHGVIVIVAVVSPYRRARAAVRARVKSFVEVFVNAPLAVCEARDCKGFYRRARSGELAHMTGLDDPYEAPKHPDVECRTDRESLEECVRSILVQVAEAETMCGSKRPKGRKDQQRRAAAI